MRKGRLLQWISSLWFAPSALAQAAEAGSLNGVYLPFWTYDAQTSTDYAGERGEDYWETETYTETVDGKSETKTRQVMKTRWWPASGEVDVPFDDILVAGTRSLPQKQLARLEPWDLPQLHAYQDEFIAGFVSQVYEVPLEEGFEKAKAIMAPVIHSAICSDIGGDHQRVFSANTSYDAVTFKHILLPVWLSAYRYQGNTYRFLVNAPDGGSAGGEALQCGEDCDCSAGGDCCDCGGGADREFAVKLSYVPPLPFRERAGVRVDEIDARLLIIPHPNPLPMRERGQGAFCER